MLARTAKSTARSCCTARSSAVYERFIGILIEHFAGRLPVWLAPGAGRGGDHRFGC
jgi:hypothetical protein